MGKRKRVRVMRKVLRQHGAPVPKKNCRNLLLAEMAAWMAVAISVTNMILRFV